jgi:putative transposase
MIQHEQATGDLSIEALAVSANGYYAWCARASSPRQQADEQLGAAIARVFSQSRRTYGSQRVWLALREGGIRTSRKRVERLVRQPRAPSGRRDCAFRSGQ